MTLADTAPVERRTGFDLSWPILIAFAAILVALIVLPMSWLVYYSLTDKGTFTFANFVKLVTDQSFRDPLVTTVILATSSAVIDGDSGGKNPGKIVQPIRNSAPKKGTSPRQMR